MDLFSFCPFWFLRSGFVTKSPFFISWCFLSLKCGHTLVFCITLLLVTAFRLARWCAWSGAWRWALRWHCRHDRLRRRRRHEHWRLWWHHHWWRWSLTARRRTWRLALRHHWRLHRRLHRGLHRRHGWRQRWEWLWVTAFWSTRWITSFGAVCWAWRWWLDRRRSGCHDWRGRRHYYWRWGRRGTTASLLALSGAWSSLNWWHLRHPSSWRNGGCPAQADWWTLLRRRSQAGHSRCSWRSHWTHRTHWSHKAWCSTTTWCSGGSHAAWLSWGSRHWHWGRRRRWSATWWLTLRSTGRSAICPTWTPCRIRKEFSDLYMIFENCLHNPAFYPQWEVIVDSG